MSQMTIQNNWLCIRILFLDQSISNLDSEQPIFAKFASNMCSLWRD